MTMRKLSIDLFAALHQFTRLSANVRSTNEGLHIPPQAIDQELQG